MSTVQGVLLHSFALTALLAFYGCTRGKPAYNVILVSIDTLRADHVGALGFKGFDITPNLDRLAAKSVLFTNAFSTASVTTASHMSMFTGLYPDEHRVNNLVQKPIRAEPLPEYLDPKVPTFPQLLRRKGFENSRFVYSRDFYLDPGLGFGRGFTVNYPFGLDSAAATNVIWDWMREERENPFFAFVHSKRPHAPYLFSDDFVADAEHQGRLDPGYKGPVISTFTAWAKKFGQKEWFGNYVPGVVPDCWFFEGLVRKGNADDLKRVRQLYALGVNLADRYLGSMITGLEESGKMENTILIVTSDHGEQLYQRGQMSHMTLHHEETHVPLLIYLPDRLRPRNMPATVSADVQTVDIMPTVLELLGLPVPENISGRSLLPLIRGESDRVHEAIYGQNIYAPIERSAYVRTPEWALIQGEGEAELYDRRADPLELRNVAGEHPEAVAKLGAMLKQKELRGYSFRGTQWQ